MKILIRWFENNLQGVTVTSLGISHRTYKKIFRVSLDHVIFEFEDTRLGGPNKFVHINETAFSFNIKAHRGKAPINKADALRIVEFENNKTRAITSNPGNKRASKIVPNNWAKAVDISTTHVDRRKG